jgi:hypothetical protein
MIVNCEKCFTTYDDVSRWTICPHGPLWAGPAQYCREHDSVNCKLPKSQHHWRIQTPDGRNVDYPGPLLPADPDEAVPLTFGTAQVPREHRWWHWSCVLSAMRRIFRQGA